MADLLVKMSTDHQQRWSDMQTEETALLGQVRHDHEAVWRLIQLYDRLVTSCIDSIHLLAVDRFLLSCANNSFRR